MRCCAVGPVGAPGTPPRAAAAGTFPGAAVLAPAAAGAPAGPAAAGRAPARAAPPGGVQGFGGTTAAPGVAPRAAPGTRPPPNTMITGTGPAAFAGVVNVA